METDEFEYVGFWPRVGAALIDTVLLMFITVPLVTLIYGRQYWSSSVWIQGPADFLINWFLPAVAVVLFWIYRQATPGKIAIGARIVDARTGAKPSSRQLVVRYLGYYVSIIPLMAGILWVAFDPRKQGWHDKLAGTVVVRTRLARDPHAGTRKRDARGAASTVPADSKPRRAGLASIPGEQRWESHMGNEAAKSGMPAAVAAIRDCGYATWAGDGAPAGLRARFDPHRIPVRGIRSVRVWGLQVDDERELPGHERTQIPDEELWEINLVALDGSCYEVESTLLVAAPG